MRKILLVIFVLTSLILSQCTSNNAPVKKLKISSFIEGSKLQETGAQKGDYIYKYDGKIVQSQDHLIELKGLVQTEIVDIVLLRDGKKIKFEIPIGQMGAVLQEFEPDHIPANDAELIEGVGKLEWGNGMDNSFLACVYLLEQKFGSKTSYNDLVGLSGYAFKFNFYDGFCPSSPDATVGFDSGGYLMKKLGYQVDYYFLESADESFDSEESMAEEGLRMLILDSIDRGWPVIAIDLIETPEWGLITGYQNHDSDFFCRTFFDKTEGYEIAQKFPWVIMVIKDKVETEIEPLYKESLILAKELYSTPKYDDYFSGISGIKQWIYNLKNEQYFEKNANQMDEVSHANWWIYVSLEIARGIGSTYISENINKFSFDQEKLKKLSEIYREEANLLVDNYDILPNQFAHAPQPWTTEMRAAQIEVIMELLKLEEKVNKIIQSL